MAERLPHTVPPTWPATIAAGRLAATIRTDSPDGCAVALLGLPDDTGVRLNNGRPGAAAGPAAFRAALAKYGTTWDGDRGRTLAVAVYDAGDVQVAPGQGADAMLETHARIEAAVGAIHAAGLVPVCIGGGHDLTLPSVAALSKHVGRAVGGVNFDAHLDVREHVGSGMAFRRLIEQRHVEPRCFVEVGLGRFANEEAHVRWLRDLGATLVQPVTADNAVDLAKRCLSAALAYAASPVAFVSIDLDVIDSSHAPGVSAPNPAGFPPHVAAVLAEAAGREKRVGHFDIMELSPPHDADGRTARVATLLFLSFLAGFQERRR